MFCRIEALKREERSKHVVATKYASGDSLGEIHEVAERLCQTHKAEGYRLHNLHTDETEEAWD